MSTVSSEQVSDIFRRTVAQIMILSENGLMPKLCKLASCGVIVAYCDNTAIQTGKPILKVCGRVVTKCSNGTEPALSQPGSIKYPFCHKEDMRGKVKSFNTPNCKSRLMIECEVLTLTRIILWLFFSTRTILLIPDKLSAEIPKIECRNLFYFVQHRTMQFKIQMTTSKMCFQHTHIISDFRFKVKPWKSPD